MSVFINNCKRYQRHILGEGMVKTGRKTILKLAALMMIVGCMPAVAQDRESAEWYKYWEHRSLLGDLDSLLMVGEATCTLATFPVDALISSNAVTAATLEEHWIGVNTFVLSAKFLGYGAGDSLGCDSLWWDFWSESGEGPFVNADGSSVVIGPNTTAGGFYGPFAAVSDTARIMYPLRIPRGRGTVYLMGVKLIDDTTRVVVEVAKMRR